MVRGTMDYKGARQSRVMGSVNRLHAPRAEPLEGRVLLSAQVYVDTPFQGANNAPVNGLVSDGAGNLYGATDTTVFEVAAATQTATTLATFNGYNGNVPNRLFVDTLGNIYGTTEYGGIGYGTPDSAGDGTVFEIAAGSGTVTTLAQFDGTNGANPFGQVVLVNGNLWGTTLNGGANQDGTVFEVAQGDTYATDYQDFDGSNGAEPYGGLFADGNGNLWGTTQQGGPHNCGTVFEVSPFIGGGYDFVPNVVSFDGDNGQWPSGELTGDAEGNLYGVTTFGGIGYTGGGGQGVPSGGGTAFTIENGSGIVSTLGEFDGGNGLNPYGALTADITGNLFGTTSAGGDTVDDPAGRGLGTVFEIPSGGAGITDVAQFNGTDGAAPAAGLVADLAGNPFGTVAGGVYGDGGVFYVAGSGYIPTFVATVAATAPQNQTATAGQAKSIALGSFSEFNYKAPPADFQPYSILVDWGDGTGFSHYQQDAAGTIAPESHTYANAGTDVVTVTAFDAKSNASNRTTFDVTVAKSPTPTGTRLSGTTYGTPGSYGNSGNTIAKATDGNLGTYFDAPSASGAAVGINLGSAKTVTQIGLAPRSGYASRMLGGVVQASNSANFSSGVVTVYTVNSTPPSGTLTVVNVSPGAAYRYWRYVGPANSNCNIAEFELFGS